MTLSFFFILKIKKIHCQPYGTINAIWGVPLCILPKSTQKVSVYPNPAINETTLVFPQTDQYTLIISDTNGKTVKQFNELSGDKTLIKIAGLNAGMYLFSLKSLTNGNTYNGKFAVTK